MCEDCVATKPTLLSRTRCEKCGHWRQIDNRKMSAPHLAHYTERQYVEQRRG